MDVTNNQTLLDEMLVISILLVLGVYFFTQSVFLSVLTTIVCGLSMLAYWQRELLMAWYKKKQEEQGIIEEVHDEEEAVVEEKPVVKKDIKLAVDETTHTLEFGTCSKTNKVVRLPVAHTGNLLVASISRFGKTSMLYNLVCHILETNTPDQCKIAFSDGKRISFNIFRKIDHLFAPIATNKESTLELITLLKAEMDRRFLLFDEIEDAICTNITEYKEVTGEELPRIIAVFDELADSVDPDSEAERMMTTVAKMGLATGIHLILSTQRLTSKGISHEVQSQCATILCGYMRSSDDYRIAKVPAPVYNQMSPEKGVFAFFSPETADGFTSIYDMKGWGLINGHYLDNDKIASIAKEHSHQQYIMSWHDMNIEVPEWAGSENDKLDAIAALDKQLPNDVSVKDVVKHFKLSSQTARNWLKRYDRR